MVRYTSLYLKWITNKNLLYSMGNCSVLYDNTDGMEVRRRMRAWIYTLFTGNYHNIVNQPYSNTK